MEVVLGWWLLVGVMLWTQMNESFGLTCPEMFRIGNHVFDDYIQTRFPESYITKHSWQKVTFRADYSSEQKEWTFLIVRDEKGIPRETYVDGIPVLDNWQNELAKKDHQDVRLDYNDIVNVITPPQEKLPHKRGLVWRFSTLWYNSGWWELIGAEMTDEKPHTYKLKLHEDLINRIEPAVEIIEKELNPQALTVTTPPETLPTIDLAHPVIPTLPGSPPPESHLHPDSHVKTPIKKTVLKLKGRQEDESGFSFAHADKKNEEFEKYIMEHFPEENMIDEFGQVLTFRADRLSDEKVWTLVIVRDLKTRKPIANSVKGIPVKEHWQKEVMDKEHENMQLGYNGIINVIAPPKEEEKQKEAGHSAERGVKWRYSILRWHSSYWMMFGAEMKEENPKTYEVDSIEKLRRRAAEMDEEVERLANLATQNPNVVTTQAHQLHTATSSSSATQAERTTIQEQHDEKHRKELMDKEEHTGTKKSDKKELEEHLQKSSSSTTTGSTERGVKRKEIESDDEEKEKEKDDEKEKKKKKTGE